MRSVNMERARKLNEMASALLAEEARLMPVALEKKDFEELIKPQFGDYQEERFVALFFDQGRRLLGIRKFEGGSRTRTVLYPRALFKAAFELDATGIVLAHNHPGGSTEPSLQDRELTRRVQQIGDSLEVTLIDHIIATANNGTFSFREAGYM